VSVSVYREAGKGKPSPASKTNKHRGRDARAREQQRDGGPVLRVERAALREDAVPGGRGGPGRKGGLWGDVVSAANLYEEESGVVCEREGREGRKRHTSPRR
jgi:hypothetical protein